VGWQDSDVLIIKGAIIVVGAVREVVSFIGSTGLIDKFKVEFGHLQEIMCNMVTDFLGVLVVLQV
jgi:hypothetical protein